MRKGIKLIEKLNDEFEQTSNTERHFMNKLTYKTNSIFKR